MTIKEMFNLKHVKYIKISVLSNSDPDTFGVSAVFSLGINGQAVL